MRVGHASLRYDAQGEDTARYIKRVLEKGELTLLTCTEFQQAHIQQHLKRVLSDRWGISKVGEYGLLFNRDVWTRKGSAHWKLTNIPGLEDHRQVDVGVWTLKVDDKSVRVMAAHLPAGIQHGKRFDSGKRAEAVKQGLKRWGERIENSSMVQLAHMDCNLDQRHMEWRTYMSRQLNARSVWSVGRPAKGGTHRGGRLIDTAHVAGVQVHSPKVLDVPRPKKIDHKPISYGVNL